MTLGPALTKTTATTILQGGPGAGGGAAGAEPGRGGRETEGESEREELMERVLQGGPGAGVGGSVGSGKNEEVENK